MEVRRPLMLLETSLGSNTIVGTPPIDDPPSELPVGGPLVRGRPLPDLVVSAVGRTTTDGTPPVKDPISEVTTGTAADEALDIVPDTDRIGAISVPEPDVLVGVATGRGTAVVRVT